MCIVLSGSREKYVLGLDRLLVISSGYLTLIADDERPKELDAKTKKR